MTTCSTDLIFQTHTLGCNSKQMGSLVFVLVRTKAGCLMNFLWTFFLSGSIQGVAIWLLQFTSWSADDNCKEYNSTLGVCLSVRRLYYCYSHEEVLFTSASVWISTACAQAWRQEQAVGFRFIAYFHYGLCLISYLLLEVAIWGMSN